MYDTLTRLASRTEQEQKRCPAVTPHARVIGKRNKRGMRKHEPPQPRPRYPTSYHSIARTLLCHFLTQLLYVSLYLTHTALCIAVDLLLPILPTTSYYFLLLPTTTYNYLLLPTTTYYFLLLPTTTYYYLLLCLLLPTTTQRKCCKFNLKHWYVLNSI